MDTQPHPAPEVKPRAKQPNQERPYLWQSRRAIEAIEDCKEVTNRPRAILVYISLTRISSENDFEPCFKTTKGLIATKSGLSVRTVTDAIPELEKAGVISVERHFDKAKKSYDTNTYTLRSFCTTPSGKNSTTPTANQEASNLPNCLRNSSPERRRRIPSSKIPKQESANSAEPIAYPAEDLKPKTPYDAEGFFGGGK